MRPFRFPPVWSWDCFSWDTIVFILKGETGPQNAESLLVIINIVYSIFLVLNIKNTDRLHPTLLLHAKKKRTPIAIPRPLHHNARARPQTSSSNSSQCTIPPPSP